MNSPLTKKRSYENESPREQRTCAQKKKLTKKKERCY